MADKEYSIDPHEMARLEYVSKVFKASNQFKPFDLVFTAQKLRLKQKKNAPAKKKEAPVEEKSKGKKKK